MPELSGIAEVKCSKCENSLIIDGSDVYVDEIGFEERSMGAEVFYEGVLEITCPKCSNEIELKYEASEYPVGAFNYSETDISGADIIRGFQDIDVSFQEEIYSFEEQSKLYLPEKKKIITNLNFGVSELFSEISKKPEILYQLDPRRFEELIANIFSRYGFSVELTKQTRDGGRDIIAVRSDLDIKSRYIIECKRYAQHRPVGVELVRSLYGVQMKEGANKSVIATTSYFTPDAVKFAETNNTTEWLMDLKGYKDILKWVRDANSS